MYVSNSEHLPDQVLTYFGTEKELSFCYKGMEMKSILFLEAVDEQEVAVSISIIRKVCSFSDVEKITYVFSQKKAIRKEVEFQSWSNEQMYFQWVIPSCCYTCSDDTTQEVIQRIFNLTS